VKPNCSLLHETPSTPRSHLLASPTPSQYLNQRSLSTPVRTCLRRLGVAGVALFRSRHVLLNMADTPFARRPRPLLQAYSSSSGSASGCDVFGQSEVRWLVSRIPPTRSVCRTSPDFERQLYWASTSTLTEVNSCSFLGPVDRQPGRQVLLVERNISVRSEKRHGALAVDVQGRWRGSRGLGACEC
jgi:hypothetical protein